VLPEGTGTLDYAIVDEGTVDFRSTVIPPSARGSGAGGRLVVHALDWARAQGMRVIPSCPFVSHVVERHPEHRDLLA
jgi:hypothetical protein